MSTPISIIGLGKLGSCMAAVYAHKGHEVIGYDLNQLNVEVINSGEAPVSENGLSDLIVSSRDLLHATSNIAEAIASTDITFIIVPTPSKPDGLFSTEAVKAACAEIGQALKTKPTDHLVVLTSTLLPGDCERTVIPAIETASQKTCGVDFGFCYSPLFIAIGSVIQNLLHPDFFLIGECNSRYGDQLEAFYKTVCDNNAPCKRMSIPSAELTKISVNSYITIKITFANMLAEVADAIPGVDATVVLDAIGNDHRIGNVYLKPGLGYGGPCFPRDNRAFAAMALRRGVKIPFAAQTDAYNQSVMDYWTQRIKAVASPDQPIGIIGMSYKPGTAFAEESQAVGICERLLKDGYTVHVYHPDGNEDVRRRLGERVAYCDRLENCTAAATVLLLGLPLPELNDVLRALNTSGTHTIIDPWRQL